jgi:hypothetical protein
LISALGKVYENLINKRLMEDIEQCGGLGRKQFGFRKNRSTVDAIEEVLSTVRGANGEKPEWSALILVDVKNAFNTASWELIVKKLEKRQISRYLLNIIKKYLSGRRVSLDRSTSEEIGGGVPQGSVLGPTLWNILYDDVMEIEVPEGVSMVCYADDLAIVVTASTREDMILKGNETLHSTVAGQSATIRFGRGRRPRGPTFARGTIRSLFEDQEQATQRTAYDVATRPPCRNLFWGRSFRNNSVCLCRQSIHFEFIGSGFIFVYRITFSFISVSLSVSLSVFVCFFRGFFRVFIVESLCQPVLGRLESHMLAPKF